MALKILTRAEDIPDGIDKIEAHAIQNGREANYFLRKRDGFLSVSHPLDYLAEAGTFPIHQNSNSVNFG
jgi:hypothetical protein